ncbi:hypothetical protein BDB00DRAFT_266989 [Zychaea mexicana]|uniref:uncharacterized protein n=1 Tax=Zychaea mexicana TaxID=64656 RepID=UPI0022FE5545|nr:uncharacterized protein BDB00DRAFT_266989 [Zychaea mexicana]KAI9495032.1 hypothetical protein BDB00DRAFT_266989 [Zychaea mexicana]
MSDPASQASTLPYDPNSLSSTIPSSGPTDITSGSSVLNDATEGNHGEAAAAPQQVAFSENDSDNNTNTNNRDSSRNTFSEESSNAIGTDRENTDESSSQDSRSPIPAYKKFWSGQTVNVASRIYEGADKPELFRQHIWKSLSYNDGGDENSNQPVKRSKSHQIPPITVAPPANKKFKSDSTGVNDKCYTTPFNQLLTLGYVVSSKMIDGSKLAKENIV